MCQKSPRYLPPARAVVRYRTDLVVIRAGMPGNTRPKSIGEDIRYFSLKSRRRLAFTIANSDIIFKSFMTLTYPRRFPLEGATCKKHMQALIKRLKRKGWADSYFWFFEFQKRGAPHIHFFLPVRVAGRLQQLWLSWAWYCVVNSGDERHYIAGTQWSNFRLPDGAVRYALKEAAKMYQKRVPKDFQKVGRFWGCSRNARPKHLEILACSQEQLEQAINQSELPYKNKHSLADLRVIFGAGALMIPPVEHSADNL
jgi:hypothetical protein